MALPRYNPSNSNQSDNYPKVAFPFVIAPSDPPQKLGRIRHFLLSPFIWKIIGGLSVVAFGALIWFFLEPLATAGDNPAAPIAILTLSSFLGILLVIRVLIAFIGNRSANRLRDKQSKVKLYIPEVMPAPRKALKRPEEKSWLVWECEEWHTVPQENLTTDEASLQKATDLLVAPDTMIVRLEVREDNRAA